MIGRITTARGVEGVVDAARAHVNDEIAAINDQVIRNGRTLSITAEEMAAAIKILGQGMKKPRKTKYSP